jgi:hypothetical protein
MVPCSGRVGLPICICGQLALLGEREPPTECERRGIQVRPAQEGGSRCHRSGRRKMRRQARRARRRSRSRRRRPRAGSSHGSARPERRVVGRGSRGRRCSPSRQSFVVGWKAFRFFDDELGIVPSYSADAPALNVLELKQRRRDAHRRYADDDMEAPSVADDCSDLEHGHRHTPNACASEESAASPAGSIPGSEACPIEGACRTPARRRQRPTCRASNEGDNSESEVRLAAHTPLVLSA